MKISDYKNEDALDLLADILEPTAMIFGDKEMLALVQNNASKVQLVSFAIKSHKKEVIEILARLEGVPVEEFSCSVLTITKSLLDIVNDKELMGFFTSQEQSLEKKSSTPATGSTKAKSK